MHFFKKGTCKTIAVFTPQDCSILFQNRAKYCNTKKLIRTQNAVQSRENQ